ncbi:MAG: hypothetical protein HQ472_02885, partial [Ignavibacteria bacterium]|nr:hypothetical protein [Ignavibacteria bacterium]
GFGVVVGVGVFGVGVSGVGVSGVGVSGVGDIDAPKELIAQELVVLVKNCRSISNQLISSVALFGDELNKNILTGVQVLLASHNVSVSRHNPFSSVKSNLSAEKASEVIKRAHLIGPLVGAIFMGTQPTSANIPTSSKAHQE